MIRRFSTGVSSFFEGIRLLRTDKTMRALSVVPAIMSLTLFTAGLIAGMMYLDEILSFVIQSNINDYNFFLKSLIYILSFLALVFILYFLIFFVVSILSIPVCTSLSQKALTQTGYLQSSSKSITENLTTFAKMAKVSVLKLGFLLMISVILFVASLLPIISPLALYLSLMILTFDCMDYAMELDELSLRQRFQFLRTHWIEFSGFALCMGVVVAIPFVHFIVLPAAVLGTTVLYARIKK